MWVEDTHSHGAPKGPFATLPSPPQFHAAFGKMPRSLLLWTRSLFAVLGHYPPPLRPRRGRPGFDSGAVQVVYVIVGICTFAQNMTFHLSIWLQWRHTCLRWVTFACAGYMAYWWLLITILEGFSHVIACAKYLADNFPSTLPQAETRTCIRVKRACGRY
jgi:hypothetical protein